MCGRPEQSPLFRPAVFLIETEPGSVLVAESQAQVASTCGRNASSPADQSTYGDKFGCPPGAPQGDTLFRSIRLLTFFICPAPMWFRF